MQGMVEGNYWEDTCSHFESLENCLEAGCQDFLLILRILSYQSFLLPLWLLCETVLM
jgi:hypothetical protein